ncbi:MAG TPA: hypothetical protein VFO23_14880, partial [Steroidobacteraceae bacterium]|nr:hypothetical protein [Steroidobacteraceae bacterium]
MKIHLFASAVVAAFLGVTAPAHSQILGGAARGGVGGAFGTTFGPSSLRGSAAGGASEQLRAHAASNRAERGATAA